MSKQNEMQGRLDLIRSKTKSPSEVLLSSETPLRPKEEVKSSPMEETKRKRLAHLKSKTKKERVEDTHTRKTYLVRNDLLDRIEKVSHSTHGFKIEFINFAIELALAEYESLEEKDQE